MKKIGEMLKKEYDAADGVARTILDAVESGSFSSESTCIDGSTRRNVDVKQLAEAVKTLKAVEELKRAITGDVGAESGSGVIEIAERE